jgi:hypothetical protein
LAACKTDLERKNEDNINITKETEQGKEEIKKQKERKRKERLEQVSNNNIHRGGKRHSSQKRN